MKILTTKEYSRFRLDQTNRPMRENLRLRKSMKAYGWLDAYPMHVMKADDFYTIKDGQHRFMEAEKLGIPVKYVVCNVGVDIATINDTQRVWQISDHVHSRAAAGDPHYQYLLQFSKAHGLPVGVSASLLYDTDVKHGMGYAVRSGKFEVKSSERAEQIAQIIDVARNHVRWARHHLFIDAVRRCFSVAGFEPERLIRKMNSHPSFMVTQANLDGFLGMIEHVYNYHSADKLSIVFELKKGG